MNIDDLVLIDKEVTIHHPDDDSITLAVKTRHPNSRDFNLLKMEAMKDESQSIATAIAIAATVEIDGIDDFDNSRDSISGLLSDDRFFWIAAEISAPYLEQKKSLTKD